MKNKKIIIGIIIGCFIVIAVILGGQDDQNSNAIKNEIIEQQETKQELIEIYKDDKLINEFLNKYNELYTDEPITSDMLSVYHHHGSDHKDQVQLTMNDLLITLTGGEYTKKLSVYIENKGNDDTTLKDLAKKFVKVFNKEITDSQIDEHLHNQGTGSDIQTYEDIEYWTNKGLNNNTIEYIKLTGKIN